MSEKPSVKIIAKKYSYTDSEGDLRTRQSFAVLKDGKECQFSSYGNKPSPEYEAYRHAAAYFGTRQKIRDFPDGADVTEEVMSCDTITGLTPAEQAACDRREADREAFLSYGEGE